MLTVSIFATCFNGLAVEVECSHRDGITEARFASSGNRLPASMFQRLAKSSFDVMKIWDAFDAERFNA